MEPNNPPVTAWQLALCTSAICNALGQETEAKDFLIEPFERLYMEAVQDGEFDDDEGEYVTLEPPQDPHERRRQRPIVDLDS